MPFSGEKSSSQLGRKKCGRTIQDLRKKIKKCTKYDKSKTRQNRHKKRREILKHTKGFRWGRKSKERAAKEALLHAWSHAFRGRKEKEKGLPRLMASPNQCRSAPRRINLQQINIRTQKTKYHY